MTAVLSEKGAITLPEELRNAMNLKAGDGFEIDDEGFGVITLRHISKCPKERLIDILLACPEPFEIPPRECELPPPPFDFNAE